MRYRSYKRSRPTRTAVSASAAQKTGNFKPMILPRGVDLESFLKTQNLKREKKTDASDGTISSNAFAGSGFQSTPAANQLPKPPAHWIKRPTASVASR